MLLNNGQLTNAMLVRFGGLNPLSELLIQVMKWCKHGKLSKQTYSPNDINKSLSAHSSPASPYAWVLKADFKVSVWFNCSSWTQKNLWQLCMLFWTCDVVSEVSLLFNLTAVLVQLTSPAVSTSQTSNHTLDKLKHRGSLFEIRSKPFLVLTLSIVCQMKITMLGLTSGTVPRPTT